MPQPDTSSIHSQSYFVLHAMAGFAAISTEQRYGHAHPGWNEQTESHTAPKLRTSPLLARCSRSCLARPVQKKPRRSGREQARVLQISSIPFPDGSHPPSDWKRKAERLLWPHNSPCLSHSPVQVTFRFPRWHVHSYIQISCNFLHARRANAPASASYRNIDILDSPFLIETSQERNVLCAKHVCGRPVVP